MSRGRWLLAALLLVAALTAGVTRPAAASDIEPLEVFSLFDTGVSSIADVCTSSLTPGTPGTLAYRITISLLNTNSVVNVEITKNSVSKNFDLNAGTALTAGNLYTFTFGAKGGGDYTYNLQCETSTRIGYLLIEEIRGSEL
jgi:hypothetical protein